MEVEGALKQLQKWIIQDGKCMTKAAFLRQTSLNMRQVESAMNKFYEQNKDLSAMFIIFGTTESDDGEGIMRRSVVCKQEKMEEAKKTFENVNSVSIYSLHRKLAPTIQALLNADWSGCHEQPAAPFEGRLQIISSNSLKGLRKWQKKNPTPISSSFVIPAFMPKIKKQPKQKAKSIIVKNDQHNLKDAFALAAKINEEKVEQKKADDVKIEDASEPMKPKESSKPKAKKKKGPNTLMDAFARAAKITKIEEEKMEVDM